MRLLSRVFLKLFLVKLYCREMYEGRPDSGRPFYLGGEIA